MSPKQVLLTLIASLLLLVAVTPTGIEHAIPDYPVSETCCVPQYQLRLKHPQFSIIYSVPSYRDSSTDHYHSLIDHLKGLKCYATLGHQDGGRWCWRYSWQNNIGVYACNDNEFHNVQVPWSLLVAYAGYISPIFAPSRGRSIIIGKTGFWVKHFIRTAGMRG